MPRTPNRSNLLETQAKSSLSEVRATILGDLSQLKEEASDRFERVIYEEIPAPIHLDNLEPHKVPYERTIVVGKDYTPDHIDELLHLVTLEMQNQTWLQVEYYPQCCMKKAISSRKLESLPLEESVKGNCPVCKKPTFINLVQPITLFDPFTKKEISLADLANNYFITDTEQGPLLKGLIERYLPGRSSAT